MISNIRLSRAISNQQIDFNRLSLTTITFCTAQDLFYILQFVVYLIT